MMRRCLLGWLFLSGMAVLSFGQTVEEWKYDDGTGYAPFAFSTDDTLAVVFDGRANMQIDSIHVAFEQSGTARVGIWRYSGVVRPSPLLDPLMPPADLPVPSGDANTVPTNESTIKWTNLDVSSMALDGSTSFVVGVIMGANAAVPGVLTGKTYTNDLPDHSYTFFTGAVSQEWTFPTDTGGYVWQFMVRAYGHSTVTGITQQLTTIPVSATLLSNYPNPFNPSTRIRFTVPEGENVRLTIHDMTGRRIAVLKEGHVASGSHEVVWDGTSDEGDRVSSGIYLGRLQTKSGVRTRKLLLMK